jgi:uncharacterized protein YutE (UPF0331/DUF86 family)
MTRLQIAVALYASNMQIAIEAAFDLAEQILAEEKSRQDYDLHLDREKNETPNDDGVPF